MQPDLFKYLREHPVGLSPLSEVGDGPFRRICRMGGAGILIAPMIAARHLIAESGFPVELNFQPMEHPLGIQVIANNPDEAYLAAVILSQKEYDFIELNASCPSRRIMNMGCGAALLKDERMIREILIAIKTGAPQKPLTLKIRLGLTNNAILAPKLVTMLDDTSLEWITVHGRYADQRYSKPADWSAIKLTAAISPFPVLGNGDISKPSQAVKMMEQYEIFAVMVGRGAFGRPWMFGRETEPDIGERIEWLKQHWQMHLREYGEMGAVVRFRKHLNWYSRGLRCVRELRRQLPYLKCAFEVEALINQLSRQ